MTSASQLDLSAIVEFNTFNRVISSLALAVLYYDFLLTISLEVERYWTSRRSWASVFFFLNRYTAIVFHIPVVYEFFFTMPQCRQLQLYHQIFTALTQGIVAVCLLLRTHALYMRDRRVIFLLGGILSLGAFVCLWTIIWFRIMEVKVSANERAFLAGCDLTLPMSQASLLAISWTVMFIYDATVFVLTFAQAIRTFRMWSHSLATLMLKDGSIYFGVLGICYLLDVVTFVVAPPGYKGILTTMTNILSNVLVSRMMLNIRDPNLFVGPHNCPSMFGDVSVPDYDLPPPLGLGDAFRSFWPSASIPSMATGP